MPYSRRGRMSSRVPWTPLPMTANRSPVDRPPCRMPCPNPRIYLDFSSRGPTLIPQSWFIASYLRAWHLPTRGSLDGSFLLLLKTYALLSLMWEKIKSNEGEPGVPRCAAFSERGWKKCQARRMCSGVLPSVQGYHCQLKKPPFFVTNQD